MKHPSIFNRLILISVFLVINGATAMVAAENGKPTEKNHPAFKYSKTATEPVIEYNLVHDMLAEPDPEPLLRIYGSGRVHVHYPAYMKKAGDYELQLSKPELDALIRELANNGIIAFDKGKAIGHRKQLEAEQHAATGVLHNISDDTTTVIDIRLEEYQHNRSSKHITNLNKRFTWKNLEHDARHFSEIAEIQEAATGANRIHGLINRPDLKKKL